jgi:hypothetical protein
METVKFITMDSTSIVADFEVAKIDLTGLSDDDAFTQAYDIADKHGATIQRMVIGISEEDKLCKAEYIFKSGKMVGVDYKY